MEHAIMRSFDALTLPIASRKISCATVMRTAKMDLMKRTVVRTKSQENHLIKFRLSSALLALHHG